MSDEIAKRAHAIQAGETFLTCKGCANWTPVNGLRDTGTIGYCTNMDNALSRRGMSFGTDTRTYNASGVVNGEIALTPVTYDNTRDCPTTTDLQCCSAWKEYVG